MNTTDFRFINFTSENQIIHIGNRSDCRTIIERVHDHRVTGFYRYIQYQTINCGTDQRT